MVPLLNIGQLYEEHALRVYKYLVALSQEPDLAEEIMQETFYVATKNLHSYRGEAKPEVWLCGIAKRLFYKELSRRHKQPQLALEELAEIPDPAEARQAALASLERLELYQLLHGLDAETREVMLLRLSGELSFAEIGTIMGQSETWARVRFYRGKQTLAQRLKEGEA